MSRGDEHMQTGDTYGSILSWRWASSRFTAITEDDSELRVQYHKTGGRWSAQPGKKNGYWTWSVLMESGWYDNRMDRYATAREAKRAAFDYYMAERDKPINKPTTKR